jgi:hypothetical protein
MSAVKIFVSHSSKYADIAKSLKLSLQALESQTLLDIKISEEMAGATDWRRWIEDNVRSADVFLLLYPHASMEMGWCNYELGRFYDDKRHIVCIKNTDIPKAPPAFQPYQYYDADEAGFTKFIKELFVLGTFTGGTPLNPDIGPNRRFDWTDIPLADLKQLKNKLGGSLNDVVLTIAAGAIRNFLIEERGYDVSEAAFRVMNPVSTRRADQKGALGNQVAMWLIDLPIEEPDPLARHQLIKERTLNLKKSNQALGAATLVEVSSGTPITLLSLANRVVGSRMRPFNMTVTNIPGPQFPMYLLEAEMLANYPMVPLWAQHGLGIALFSYNGRMLWGIHADYDTFPDSDVFLKAIHASYAELRDLEVPSA